MTDGERLVWATSYALARDRLGPVAAVREATLAITQLREASRHLTLSADDRDFADEMVNAP